MKTVLFATTALVAFAGVAAAQEVTWSGDVTIGYNDDIEGGLYYDGTLNIEASVDLGDNVTASLEYNVLELDTLGLATAPSADVPTLTIAFDNGTISASLIAGDLDDAGASELWYSDRDGMDVDAYNYDNNINDVIASVEFGSFGIAMSCIGPDCAFSSYGAKASLGSIDIAAGYDSITGINRQAMVSVDATFGSISVGASYLAGENLGTGFNYASIGVDASYDISDAISVSAYVAVNAFEVAVVPLGSGVDGDVHFGGAVDYTAGALTVGAYYDSFTATDQLGATIATGSSYGIDVAYAVNDQLTVSAGVFDGGTMVYYAGIDYAVNDSISATISYATADEISGPEYKDGITALITASF